MTTTALFAYGTLMFAEVCREIVGRDLSARPARLDGYGRYCLRHDIFPGLVPRVGEQTQGILYDGLGEDDWLALDDFEGEEYERWVVTVFASDRKRVAETYLLRPHLREALTKETWHPAQFAAAHLANFVRKLAW